MTQEHHTPDESWEITSDVDRPPWGGSFQGPAKVSDNNFRQSMSSLSGSAESLCSSLCRNIERPSKLLSQKQSPAFAARQPLESQSVAPWAAIPKDRYVSEESTTPEAAAIVDAVGITPSKAPAVCSLPAEAANGPTVAPPGIPGPDSATKHLHLANQAHSKNIRPTDLFGEEPTRCHLAHFSPSRLRRARNDCRTPRASHGLQHWQNNGEQKQQNDGKGETRLARRVPPWTRPFLSSGRLRSNSPERHQTPPLALCPLIKPIAAQSMSISRRASTSDMLSYRQHASKAGLQREASWSHPVHHPRLLRLITADRERRGFVEAREALEKLQVCWSMPTTQGFSACAAGASRAAAAAAEDVTSALKARWMHCPVASSVKEISENKISGVNSMSATRADSSRGISDISTSHQGSISCPHAPQESSSPPASVSTVHCGRYGKRVPMQCSSQYDNTPAAMSALNDAPTDAALTSLSASAASAAPAVATVGLENLAALNTANVELQALYAKTAALKTKGDLARVEVRETAGALGDAERETGTEAAATLLEWQSYHSTSAWHSKRGFGKEPLFICHDPEPPAGDKNSSSTKCETPIRLPRKVWRIFKTPRILRLKVVTFGPPKSGKSCLVRRFCERRFVGVSPGAHEQLWGTLANQTIGSDFGLKDVELASGETVRLHFVDLSGAPVYAEAGEGAFLGADVMMCVFDSENPHSLKEALVQLQQAKSLAGTDTPRLNTKV
ncbi:Ras family domain-containing protein [Cyclospora cayetanensis]|uniref:Ras family domain-containing protein n=1 Tax=Cyclospora cayetanensis TaxID=88456 RepID=A0A1D3CTI1_9EIME|nr:Ras family domain-containing protein [Cyclospora cayetanensis]